MYWCRPVGIVAILLTVAFAVSPVCLASSGSMVGTPGGCPGNHGPTPMPFPAHSCCFAAHQIPAAGPIALFHAGLDARETDIVNTAAVDQSHHAEAARVPAVDTSPPLSVVLRV